MADIVNTVYAMRAAGLDLWITSNGNLMVETLDAALLNKWRSFIVANKLAIIKALGEHYSPDWRSSPVEGWPSKLTIRNLTTDKVSTIGLGKPSRGGRGRGEA